MEPTADPDIGPSSDRYEAWNNLLFSQARFFVSRYQDYSSIRRTEPHAPVGNYSTHSRSSSQSQSSAHSGSTSPSYTSPGPSPLTTPNGAGVQGDLSMFIFSSWDTFISILDYPEAYDFEESDIDEPQGPIWSASTLCSNPCPKANATLGWIICTLRAKYMPFSQSIYSISSPAYDKRQDITLTA